MPSVVKIDAKNEIENSGFHPKVIDYLLKTSVAVNTLYTPFDEKEWIDVVATYQREPIRQIGYAYEAPGFSRAGQYVTRPGLDLNSGKGNVDIAQPGVYGLSRHPDDSIGLLMFVRGEVIQLTPGPDRGVDRHNIYLNGIFSQYRRLVNALLETGRPDPKLLAMVGILPGVAIKRAHKFPEYADIIEMCRAKNLNSGRFIQAAVKRLLEEHQLKESSLIILGSGGTLGHAVAQYFPKAQLIDLSNQKDFPSSGKWMIVDCTTGGSLLEYKDKLQDSLKGIWVNEAYPPPDKKLALEIQSGGTISIHIKGVAGEIIPPFPEGYDSTPPCCIGLLDQDANTVVITRWPPES